MKPLIYSSFRTQRSEDPESITITDLNFPFYISKRYLIAKKSKNAINIIGNFLFFCICFKISNKLYILIIGIMPFLIQIINRKN